MNIFTKILPFAVLSCFSSMSFADAAFNQNLEKIIECKSTLSGYNDLGWEFEADLKKNGWKKIGKETDYTYQSAQPIQVYGMQANQINLVVGGILAVVNNQDTAKLAQQYQIKQHPLFEGMPYFSGEKIVKTDPETDTAEKSFRKMTLAEPSPELQTGAKKTFIGCVYISEDEHNQQEEAIKEMM